MYTLNCYFKKFQERSQYFLTLCNISTLYRKLGKFDKASECVERGFAIARRYYGSENHPCMSSRWQELAMVHEGRPRYAKAAKIWARAMRCAGKQHALFDFLHSTLSAMLCISDSKQPKELGFEGGSTFKCVVIEQRVCELWQRWSIAVVLSSSLHTLLPTSRLAIAS
jgi:tetratricopeptide (TPR) repeat protein